jgi:Type VI secretion system (T6SS), amidase immunity protein
MAVVLTPSGRNVPEPDLLRGYAFASCLAEGYRGTAFAEDADRVADMYMQAGKTTTPEAYQKLRQAAKDAHPEKHATMDNANVAIMVCLELYESKSLRGLVAHSPSAKK